MMMMNRGDMQPANQLEYSVCFFFCSVSLLVSLFFFYLHLILLSFGFRIERPLPNPMEGFKADASSSIKQWALKKTRWNGVAWRGKVNPSDRMPGRRRMRGHSQVRRARVVMRCAGES